MFDAVALTATVKFIFQKKSHSRRWPGCEWLSSFGCLGLVLDDHPVEQRLYDRALLMRHVADHLELQG